MDKKLVAAEKLLQGLSENIIQQIPFCKLLGLTLEEITFDHVFMSFSKTPELVGNFILGILHGGVIASVLDTAGGAVAMANVFRHHASSQFSDFKVQLSKVTTIDMRVDYLQPGEGEHFRVSATLLRSGKRICVTRMELHNQANKLIAAGTATYLMG